MSSLRIQKKKSLLLVMEKGDMIPTANMRYKRDGFDIYSADV